MRKAARLEISYHRGRPIAAYLYLHREASDKAARSRKAGPELVVDYAADGRPIGIEILHVAAASAGPVNELLAELHQRALSEEELTALCTA